MNDIPKVVFSRRSGGRCRQVYDGYLAGMPLISQFRDVLSER